MSSQERELRELRDAVNTTRVVLRGLQNQARAAVRLAADLEQRLELFDNRVNRLAMEAKHVDHHREAAVSNV